MNKFISPDCIQQIKTVAATHEVIQDFIPLKSKGAHYEACCPFHKEKTPSFKIHPKRNSYKCFGCGASGDAIEFLRKHQKLDFTEAIEYLGNKYGLSIEYEQLSAAQEREIREIRDRKSAIGKVLSATIEEASLNDLPPEFLGRKYTESALKAAKIGFLISPPSAQIDKLNLKGTDLLNPAGKFRFANRICFPIFDLTGSVIAISGRAIGQQKPKYLHSGAQVWDKKNALYGIHVAHQFIGKQKGKEDTLYLCEGPTDVLRMWSQGLWNTCALLGTHLHEGQISLIKKLTENICYIADNDGETGRKAIDKIARKAIGKGLNVSVLVPEYGDPDEYLATLTQDEALGFIQTKQPYIEDYLLTPLLLEIKEKGPIFEAEQVEQLGALILSIPDDTKRMAYYELVSSRWKLFRNQIKLPKNVKLPVNHHSLSEENLQSYMKDDFYVENGYIMTLTNQGVKRVANFTFKVKYFLEHESEQNRILLQIKTCEHRNFLLMALATDLSTLNSFKKLISNRLGVIWLGTNATESIFQAYKAKAMKEAKTAYQLETIGRNAQRDFWVWGNGITKAGRFYPCQNNGIIELEAEQFYFPWAIQANSYVEDVQVSGYRSAMVYRYAEQCPISLEYFFELFFAVHQRKAPFLILFYLASLFWRDIYQMYQYFPLLFLYGVAGSGKSNGARSLQYMFGGIPQADGINIPSGGTTKGIQRLMASVSNIPTYLSEYNQNLPKQTIEFLKSLADGASDARGKFTNDNQTVSSQAKSSTIITGNDLPTNNLPLMSRCLILTYNKSEAKQWNDEKFEELNELLQTKSMSHLTNQLLSLQPTVTANYKKVRASVKEKIRLSAQNKGVKLEARDYNNITPFLTIFELAKISYPILTKYIDEEGIYEQYLEVFSHNNELYKEQDLVIDFLLTIRNSTDFKQGIHYDFTNQDNGHLYFYFKLRETYKDIYQKESYRTGEPTKSQHNIKEAILEHPSFHSYEPKNLRYDKLRKRSSGFLLDYVKLYYEYDIIIPDGDNRIEEINQIPITHMRA
ncbi:DNA primase [Persicobacter psychrovividus]